ncbi:uncharacterized protein TRIADDRAFT_60261 [Trichoplax adhaerens]|uniref:KIF-binding protein n=1 Tax=Trichoplax adhaerens TaxID=10228 RepID=B3S7R2_TRIAD|nr:hypothetical protein TRIADDRAFT_60261 [Trichoplax adhaerens]EDV21336.1 hypothetical protein TRIADDRAFT_60261 [Trichoplax adhaerens]|eukprot:XP_002116303.1 hypothetical protein TRIADDRAFT_60261 [Trichoplax adhaerens]
MAESRYHSLQSWRQFACFETFKEILDLNEKVDAPEEPFKSKYEALELLYRLRKEVEDFYDDNQEAYPDAKQIAAVLDYHIGVIHLITEDRSTGQRHIKACLEALRPYRLEPDFCLVVMKANSEMGILWCGRSDFAKSQQYLEECDKLYSDYTADVGNSPYDEKDLLLPPELRADDVSRHKKFESSYTHALYYLAQVYTKQENDNLAAEYCHKTLSRQLESKDFDSLDWAINCATLSDYYTSKRNWNLARHCLACASAVIGEDCRVPDSGMTEEELREESQAELDEREKVYKKRAEVARLWAKYALELFTESRNAVENHGAESVRELHISDNPEASRDRKNILYFDGLETTSYDESIPDHLIADFDEARKVFLTGLRWSEKAKDFFILDGHTSDHVELVQLQSRLYFILAFFEKDLERQCKMHKRRVDLLTSIEKELNPQFFLTVCQQLCFEIGETTNEMVTLKIAIGNREDVPSVHTVKKINSLIQNSVEHFNKFIGSFVDRRTGKLPETIHDDYLRPILLAKFYLARLWKKYIAKDTKSQMEFLSKSLQCLEYIVQYADAHSDMPKVFEDELVVSREMAHFLPYEISKLAEQLH